ncbi:type II secretion system protein [Paraclostridium bifermentans]|uniref:type II secretion system protein n=1 Tax=Paraclostridium bifermentans TaxID=1490 RepID=UPI00359CA738
MKQNDKGFTLIELLVVIAIIGILAIVALPALFENINKAKTAELESDYNAIKSSFLSTYAEKTELINANVGITNASGNDKNIEEQLESVPKNNPFGGIYSISTGNQILYNKDGSERVSIIYQYDSSKNNLEQKRANEVIKDNSVYLIAEPAWETHPGYDGKSKNNIGYDAFKKLSNDIGSSIVFSQLDLKPGENTPNNNTIYIKLAD